jgi:hypothetical protein
MPAARLLATAATLVGLTTVARADLRSFTHTYEYATMPAHKTAIEIWHTQTRATSDAESPHLYEGIFEIEHGITDHWDVAFYTVLGQVSDEMLGSTGLTLSEIKLETRYRLAERGELPIDTLLYFEVAKEFGESLYELEAKVIGARDFGAVTVAANVIAELVVGKDAEETEPEFGWAVGATYPVHPKVRVGVETWGIVEEGEAYISAGPALSLAPASNLWATLTVGFGVSEDAREEGEGAEHGYFSGRLIVGIEL